MNILVLGLSHHTAPIEIREKLAIPVNDIPQLLVKFNQLTGINEAVILSTCNRTEIYAVSQIPLREVLNQIKVFLAETIKYQSHYLTLIWKRIMDRERFAICFE
jgi:glutamyl-tRNA reductase